MLRPQEKQAADRLLAYLKKVGHSASYMPGEDPPDALFTVDDESWALEITELHLYAAGGPHGEVTDSNINAWHFGIRESLNSLTEGRRKCGWLLDLAGPLAPAQLAAIKQDAVRAICADDERTFAWPGDMATLIRLRDSQEVDVMSGLSVSATVPASGQPAFDVGAVVDYAVRARLEAKAARLTSVANGQKRVLLFDSVYQFARHANVRDAITANSRLADAFELIFLITQMALLPGRVADGAFVSRVGGSDGIGTFGISGPPIQVGTSREPAAS